MKHTIRQLIQVTRHGLNARAVAYLLLALVSSVAQAITPANTTIVNTVVVTYSEDGTEQVVRNSAAFTTQEINPASVAPTAAEITLQRLTGNDAAGIATPPTECSDGSGNYSVISSVSDIGGTSYSLPGTFATTAAEYGFKIGEPLLITLADGDKNLYNTIAETIVVTLTTSNGSDTEQLRLTETGVNTGVFAGVINTAPYTGSDNLNNCALNLTRSETVTASYTDSYDPTDTTFADADFDPYSRIFDAETGQPINGIEVTLIDVATGEPATVYDDDGVTEYPSTVTTGPSSSNGIDTQADDDGSFPDGSFRFPYIPAGEYRLEFNAPDNYRVPSSASDEDLEALGSFAINNISRGEAFNLKDHVLLTDIPADNLDTGLLVSKTANKTEVGIGDFIQYTITVSNEDLEVTDGTLVDQLPPGLRYRSGSARYEGEKVADPAISGNGRTLRFALPDLAEDSTFKLTYVTQVTALAKDDLVNYAWLEDDIASSNRASASVVVTDEFFKDTARLFGRVYLDDCDGNLDAEAVPNIRLYMEDGTYVVTDENGEWHIENVRPGTHVVQLDTASVPPYTEVMTCDQRGFHAGRSFSQFVDVQGGSFWRVDFALKMKKPETGDVSQRMTHELIPLQAQADGSLPYNSPVPEKLRYKVFMQGQGVEITNLMEMISLPEGVVYEPGSTLLDGEAWNDPRVSYGTLIYQLGDRPAKWQHELTFTAVVSDKAKSGELKARAVTRFKDNAGNKSYQIKPVDTTAILQLPPEDGTVKQISPPKFSNFSDELTEEDKFNLKHVVDRLRGLRNLKVEVVGHTDSTPIAARNRHIYADNQALSEARAASVAKYIAEQLQIDPSQIISDGKGSADPVASNGTALGRAKNRRVDVNVLNGDPDIQLASIGSDVKSTHIEASLENFLVKNMDATAADGGLEEYNAPEMPEFNEKWFNTASDYAQWLWPPVDRSPAIASTKIAISHAKDERIKLLLDDKPVSVLNFDGTEKSNKRDLAVSTWRGVDLEPGPNHFTVYVINKDGDIVDEFKRTVQFAQVPAKAVLVPEKTQAIADGINPPVIAVRMTDKEGFPIRYGVAGDLNVQEPYRLYDINKQIEANPLGDTQKVQYHVGNDGIALIRLEPTTKAGEVHLSFEHSNGQEDDVKVWLKPQQRDWILVGMGDMSVGYNSASGDRSSMSSADVDQNIYHDGRLAFFTQGQVSGEWLITAAYDSGKPEAEAFASMIEPDRYYTLYGDASQQQLDASSARKLYVRVERERFYAMFGDINTNLNSTTLSSYTRAMTGAQAEYQDDVFELSGFISQSDNGTMRDEIQGDGTSGLYRLSSKNIVLNSETITLEVRDRYRSEVIVDSQTLTRDIDYVLDYNDGTIYFKQPIRANDENFNPRYIVAEYDVESGETGYVSGGRAGVKLMDDKVKAGVTAITQNQRGEDISLRGADVQVKLGDTEIKAEVAQSEEVVSGNSNGANAHLLEVTHRTEKVEATAYVRSQDEDFGFTQSPQGENDYRKEGVEGSVYVTDKDRIDLEGFHHYQLSTGYDTYQMEAEWTRNLDRDNQFSVGMLTSQDETETETLYSDQMTAGYTTRVFNSRLALSAGVMANVSERSDDDDALTLGADYRLTDKISLYGNQEMGLSSDATQRTTLGVRATPWSGASVDQSFEQVEEDDAYRLFAVSGLNQEIPLNDQWSMSVGFDQAQNLEANVPGESSDTTEDYYAMYAGAAYRTEAWQWNSRLERRDGDTTDKWVARTSLYHPLSDALATGGSAEYFTEESDDSDSNQLDLTFDLALRPRKLPVAMLWQTRWEQANQSSADSAAERSRKLINNVHANWLIAPSDQLAGQYGIKRVLDQYDSEDYASTTDFMAAEWRHHLNARWDVGAHGRRLHSYESGQSLHGAGVSVGWIPKTNVWLGLGYNFTGFVDTDFSAANFTAKGV
ncbi:MAG: hypothetical protein CMH99_01965, partial [Oceanospirillaceae bacterium]|nr:hypothetical protein [Oceanospirillaceae bacterium]